MPFILSYSVQIVLYVQYNIKRILKGIVQRDLTEVETRLKRFVLMKLIVAKFDLNFKGTPSREEHKTGFSVLTTIQLNLPLEFTKFC